MKPIALFIVEAALTQRLRLSNRLSDSAQFQVRAAFASLSDALAAAKVTEVDAILFDKAQADNDTVWGLAGDLPASRAVLVPVPRLFSAVVDDTFNLRPDAIGLVTQAIEKACRVKLPNVAPQRHDPDPIHSMIVIGASTGGVEALGVMLSSFPPDCPPTLIVLHMAGAFTASFAARVDKTCAAKVCEARDGAKLRNGQIWIAPGGERHLEVKGLNHPQCSLVDDVPVSGHRPSVDVLFRSAAAFSSRVTGVLLTGMGKDGARGLLEIRSAGGQTFAQDEQSCVVYGMPRVAMALGGVQRQVPISKMTEQVLQALDERKSPGRLVRFESGAAI